MTKQFFCTFFDHRYLDRGLALAHSLQRQDEPYHLWILCMDRQTFDDLSRRGMKDVTLVTMANLEAFDRTLSGVRENRSLVEFYFTCKSFLCLYILKNYPGVNLLTYLDADLFFFSRPSVIEEEMTGYSIGLTGHRFPAFLKELEQFGMFNAGFVSFRRDDEGLACLTWWRDQCVEWCHDYVDNGRYADQRYLDYIPGKFSRVKVIDHKGINLAPWNLAQYRTTGNDAGVMIDGDPLVLYHFHGVKRAGNRRYDTGSYNYRTCLSTTVRNDIYRPYIAVLETERLREITVSPMITRGTVKSRKLETFFPSFLAAYRSIVRLLKGLRYRSYIAQRNQ